MFIFGISNLFQFFARGKNHSLVRFGQQLETVLECFFVGHFVAVMIPSEDW